MTMRIRLLGTVRSVRRARPAKLKTLTLRAPTAAKQAPSIPSLKLGVAVSIFNSPSEKRSQLLPASVRSRVTDREISAGSITDLARLAELGPGASRAGLALGGAIETTNKRAEHRVASAKASREQ